MEVSLSFFALFLIVGTLALLVTAIVAMYRTMGAFVASSISLVMLMGIAFVLVFFLSVQRSADYEREVAILETSQAATRPSSLAELEAAQIVADHGGQAEAHDDDHSLDRYVLNAEQRQAAIEGALAAERPKWVQASGAIFTREEIEDAVNSFQTIPDTFVVRSGLWSTKEEAVADVNEMAESLIGAKARAAFAPQYNEASIRRGFEQNKQLLGRSYTQSRMVKLTPEVETEMVRAYLEVKTAPEELQAFTPVVRHYAAQERLKLSATALVSVILFAIFASVLIDWRGKSDSKQPGQ